MLSNAIQTLTKKEDEILSPYFKEISFARGSIILEQFEPPCGLYFVTEGTVRLFKLAIIADNLCAMQLADLAGTKEEPVLLGETSLLLNQITSCTVIASTDVKAFHCSSSNFMEIKEKHPQIMLNIMSYIAETLAFRTINLQEKFESRIIGQATNPHTALALLRKYVGNVKMCTPQMANKLFQLEDAVL